MLYLGFLVITMYSIISNHQNLQKRWFVEKSYVGKQNGEKEQSIKKKNDEESGRREEEDSDRDEGGWLKRWYVDSFTDYEFGEWLLDLIWGFWFVSSNDDLSECLQKSRNVF